MFKELGIRKITSLRSHLDIDFPLLGSQRLSKSCHGLRGGGNVRRSSNRLKSMHLGILLALVSAPASGCLCELGANFLHAAPDRQLVSGKLVVSRRRLAKAEKVWQRLGLEWRA